MINSILCNNIFDVLNTNGHTEKGNEKQAVKPKELLKPFTAPWVIRRIRDDELDNALTQLRIWMPEKRREEVDTDLVNNLRQLKDEEALTAMKMLRKPRMFIRGSKGLQLDIPVLLQAVDTLSSFKVQGLLDSGCTGSCIDKKFVVKNRITTIKAPIPTKVYNADGTLHSSGSISEYVTMRMSISDHSERIQFGVVDLGKSELFIGHDWLKFHNPSIDWQKSTVAFDRCPSACGYTLNYVEIDEDPEIYEAEEDTVSTLDTGDRLFVLDYEGYLQQKANIRKLWSKPDYLAMFSEVFGQKEFYQLPNRRPWDHAIELTPGAKPADCKIYPLNKDEQKALDEFLEETLKTGRIRSSKSPMVSPFFFVKKKDGKLRPVQDYRKLNEITVMSRLGV